MHQAFFWYCVAIFACERVLLLSIFTTFVAYSIDPVDFMTHKTLRDIYLNSVSQFAGRQAFSMFGGEGLTYADFETRVDQIRELLLGAGINAGDKVALLSSSMPNWAAAYFAVVTSGMVIVPILPDFTGREIDMIIVHSEAKALVVSDKQYSKISKDTLCSLNIVIRSKNLGVISQKINQRGQDTLPQGDDVAAIIYTSGTTSAPKGVMLTHGGLHAQLDMVLNIKNIVKEDVFLSILPMSHVYECSFGMLLPFYRGASVVYLEKPPTASILMPALKAVRPTVMLSVPLIIEKIYRSQVAKRFSKNRLMGWLYRLPVFRKVVHRMAGRKLMQSFGGRIDFFGIGGAKLDAMTERFLAEARFPYAIGYGLTETAPLLAGAAPGLVRFQSTGPAMPGVKIRLENVNPGTGQGEIVALTPSVMKGYYKNPEATSAVFTSDGWFRTKDLGFIDKDGYLYIKGRLGNMIVGPSGENIYPEEIEDILNSHLYVTDSIVKEDRGRLVAMVHFDPEELERRYKSIKEGWRYKMDEVKSELMHYVNTKVNKFSRISDVEEKNDGFEKTPTQKIKRFLYTKNNK